MMRIRKSPAQSSRAASRVMLCRYTVSLGSVQSSDSGALMKDLYGEG